MTAAASTLESVRSLSPIIRAHEDDIERSEACRSQSSVA